MTIRCFNTPFYDSSTKNERQEFCVERRHDFTRKTEIPSFDSSSLKDDEGLPLYSTPCSRLLDVVAMDFASPGSRRE